MEASKNVQQEKLPKTSVEKKLEVEIEELEPIVAPRIALNHNETLVRDFAR